MTKFTTAISLLVPVVAFAIGPPAPGSDPHTVDVSRTMTPTDVVIAASIAGTAPVAVGAGDPLTIASVPTLFPDDVAADPESAPSAAPEGSAGVPLADPFGPVTSPDVGDHCAASLDAADITEFFAHPIGSFAGADYQRALRLPDDRVLWTFQDVFLAGTLVHNVGMIQSGRCFTLLNDATTPWLFGNRTSRMQRWHWILGGGLSADGTLIHLFVVQMDETGGSYLSRTRPTALHRVVLDAVNFGVVEVVDESWSDGDLYGWDVTSDADYTYLYSWCYQQFGYDTMLGFGECVADVKVARVPLGEFGGRREYWDGGGWTPDPTTAAPIVDAAFVGAGDNPAQIRFDGRRFVLVEKRDDWWGTSIEFGVAADPQGPFAPVASVDEPLACDRSTCNTYFAAWVPWNDNRTGDHIWSISHNRWNGTETHDHLVDYRPTFSTIDLERHRTATA